MGKYLSQLDLSNLYKSEVKKHGEKNIQEIGKLIRKSDNRNTRNSIFLCHSHLDKTIVNKILLFFKNLDIELYVDWMDMNMPDYTDRNTASIIKTKIDSSTKFLFLATYNGLRSKWCNWELGLAYSSKGENDFAILPIETKLGNWSGNEYLQLYPEMQIESIGNLNMGISSQIKIDFYGTKTIDFNDWFLK